MKIFYTLLILITMLSCSTNKNNDSKIEGIEEQYIEDFAISTQPEEEIDDELRKLHSIKPGKYKIKPGDKFHIFVYEEPDLDTDDVIVKPDGTITFKLIGEVKIQDLTVSEATALIEDKLKKYIKYPKVTLSNYSLTSSRVTILGKVVYPGSYDIDNNSRMLDIIAKSGGFSMGYFQNNSVELADLERSYIVRNSKLLPVNFKLLIREGNMLHNIPLLDGDYIYIPSAINKEIYVLGEVNEQGHLAYKEDMTLLHVISFAQGLKKSAGSTIYIIRGNLSHPQLYSIDLRKVLSARERDFKLKPNDIIFVPQTRISNWNDFINNLLPTLTALKAIGVN